MDYFRNVVGWEHQLRIFILDDLQSWACEENQKLIESMCNAKIVALEGGMTPFLQPLYVDMSLFAFQFVISFYMIYLCVVIEMYISFDDLFH